MQCSDPPWSGFRGRSSRSRACSMITIVSGSSEAVTVPKNGTVLQLAGSGKIVIGDEMSGRVEDRLARGSKV